MVSDFVRLVREDSPARFAILLSLMLLAGLTEGAGIMLLVPLLALLQGAGAGDNRFVQGLDQVFGSVGLGLSTGTVLIAFLVLVALRAAILFLRDQTSARLQYRLVDRLRARSFAALLGAEWRWTTARRQSDHINLLTAEAARVGIGLTFGLSLLAALAMMAAYGLAALALSWKMTLVALAGGGLVLLALSGQHAKAVALGQSLGDANKAMQASIQDSLGSLKLAKILGTERRHLDYFTHVVARVRAEVLRFQASTGLAQALFQVGGAAALALYVWAGLVLWAVPGPELLTLVVIFARLIPMFSTAQQHYHRLLHALPAVRQVQRLVAEAQGAAEPAAPADLAPWPVNQAIALDAVTVRYAERERCALDRVTLAFPARTTTAIVGASGAGKSTLADVVMGLVVPDAGGLLVDGQPVTGPARQRWRRSVAYVPQEVFLFNDTIRRNLLWGEAGAGEDDLRQALRRAAADFVLDLPQGLDTVVGDGGLRLSGGERQRLALARALLRRPALLILDEATSALDMENEQRVRGAIETLHGDLTVILIGHRLATLEHADQVVVLGDGQVLRQGTWDQVAPRASGGAAA
ncbi:ABC transporter ATP-binding protein [Zavarzinia sp. CC-PAN008]|uniref:ABC transporter ATP-binding protein n=1 Tax=Zavarzinia sp. CC-PAN008 TaxID=3243332 RepID=UPI003F743EAB